MAAGRSEHFTGAAPGGSALRRTCRERSAAGAGFLCASAPTAGTEATTRRRWPAGPARPSLKNPRELAVLLQQSQSTNERLGLTGMLLHADGRFFQVLEGPTDLVARRFPAVWYPDMGAGTGA